MAGNPEVEPSSYLFDVYLFSFWMVMMIKQSIDFVAREI